MLVGRRLLLPLRPPRPRPLGGGGALGDALVRRRRGHPARRRAAHLRPRRRLRAGGAALPAGGARRRRRCRRGRRLRARRARSRPPSSAGSCSPGSLERGRSASTASAIGAGGARRSASAVAPNLAFPEPASSPSSSPPSSRSRSGAAARSPHPRPRSEERAAAPGPRRLSARRDRCSGWRRTRWAATRCGSAPSSAARCWPRSCSPTGRARVPVSGSVALVHSSGGLYWQVTASVTQIARSVGDPRPRPLTSSPPRTGCATTAATAPGRGAADREPLGVGLPGAEVELARGWLRQLDTTRDDIFYDDDEPLNDATLRRLAARQRDPLRRPPRRAPRLLLGRRAAPDPRASPPYLRLRWQTRRTGASTRCATPRRSCEPLGGGGGQRLLGRPPGLRPRRHRARRIPRPRQLHALLVDRPRQRLPAAPRRLDRCPRRRTRRLPRRRRLLPRPRLERGDRRPQDLLRTRRLAHRDRASSLREKRRLRRLLAPRSEREQTAALRAASGPGRGIRRPRRRRGCGGRRRG